MWKGSSRPARTRKKMKSSRKNSLTNRRGRPNWDRTYALCLIVFFQIDSLDGRLRPNPSGRVATPTTGEQQLRTKQYASTQISSQAESPERCAANAKSHAAKSNATPHSAAPPNRSHVGS